MKLLTVVAGFAIFPPLGIAALVYFLWAGRRHGYGRDRYAFAAAGGQGCGRRHRCHSGNSAFDAHRDEVLNKLRAEREAFDGFRSEQRRKRDQESFDAFRNARAGEGPATAQ